MIETVREKILKVLHQLPNVRKDEIDAIVDFQKKKGIGLSRALVEKGIISEGDLMSLMVNELHIPSIDLRKYKVDPALKDIITEKAARQYRVMPISHLRDTVTIALSDPLNISLIDDIQSLTNKKIDVVMATDTQIMKSIETFYGSKDTTTVAEVSKNIDIEDLMIVSDQTAESMTITDATQDAPIIRMVSLIIKEAIKQRASDIHLEPGPDEMRVRFRIDGILQEILTIPKENQNAVVTRVKIMARLNITVNQVPQDGRFKMRFGSQEVDFRVSILPTNFGQKIVMRVLDRTNLATELSNLGFSKRSVELLAEAITKPFGMILVTGPTGSGKSTTLYSLINQLNTVDKNIITVEDPVEYLMEGLTQIEVKPEIGLTFAAGLRAILRQSPDIVMVGEIRDAETADISIKAALTGQLVLSTLHTNDSAGALTRLVDMGIEPFLVSSSLVLVCAQRLCRRVCKNCKVPVEIPVEVLQKLAHKIPKNTVFYEGKGCDRCRQTGYMGRLGITEVLVIDDQIREMLLKGKSSDEIKNYAQKEQKMFLLWDDIVEKFIEGFTTITEVFRVTSDED